MNFIRRSVKLVKAPLSRGVVRSETRHIRGSYRYKPPAGAQLGDDVDGQPINPQSPSHQPQSQKALNKLLKDSVSATVTNPADDPWTTGPYPKGTVDPKRSQAFRSVRPAMDPSQTSIVLFPGQGSQFVGMAKHTLECPNVRMMFDVASSILDYDLLSLCLNGPRGELDRTIHCQPAVFVTSLAAVEKLKEEKPGVIASCIATAGFSLGELTALVFANAMSFEDGLRLVKVRAEAMQRASMAAPSGMVAVFYGADAELKFAMSAAREWCKRRGVTDPQCAIANFLYPNCKVIAGHDEALKFIELNYRDFKLRRIKRLPVSGAFHTQLMASAIPEIKMALEKVDFRTPHISVHSNVDSHIMRDIKHIKRNLIKQIVEPVKWEQILHVIYERNPDTPFPNTYECGPGNQLRTILKFVNQKAHDTTYGVDV